VSDEARLENLESTVAFQERTIGQLNDVVIDQQQRIEQLEAKLVQILERLPREERLVRDLADEDPPPHY